MAITISVPSGSNPPQTVMDSAQETVQALADELAPNVRSTVKASLEEFGNEQSGVYWKLTISWQDADGTHKSLWQPIDDQGKSGQVHGSSPNPNNTNAQEEEEEEEEREREREQEEEGPISLG